MAKEINVLAVSYGRNLFDINNVERLRMELCAGEVHSYHMIIFSKHADALSVVEGANGLVLHPTNSKTRLHMLFDAVRIGSIILKDRAGKWVITSQDPFETGLVGYILARRHRVKLNVQEHGDFFSGNYWRKESFLNRVRFIFGKWLLRKADTVRVVSSHAKATMESLGVSSERILRLAVRTDVQQTEGLTEASATDLHTEYPEASIIILSMARFVPQKNLSLLIDAFSSLHTQNTAVKLILVGSGPEEQMLRQLVSGYELSDAVVFKQWTEEPQAYMQTADIYALSSNYEGWGRVLIEAMLTGTPIVTTDVGCANEVLKDGVHGFVVPIGDTQKFSDALKSLAENYETRKQFSVAAQNDICSIQVTSEEYASKWAALLSSTMT